MNDTKKIIEDLSLVSATFVASGYAILCFIGIIYTISEFKFVLHQAFLMLFLLFGMIGYTGFLSLIFNGLEKKLIQSIVLLIIGVIVCLVVILLPGFHLLSFSFFLSFGDFFEILIAFWPVLVAIYFILKISNKLIQQKKVKESITENLSPD